MPDVKYRYLRIPVIEFIPALAFGLISTVGSALLWNGNPMLGAAPGLAYTWYCLHQLVINDGKSVRIPIPWPHNTKNALPVEPPHEPRAWPPEPGQCYVCGIHDPEREKTLGDATHPECKEWLGDWKPPAPHITTSGITGYTQQRPLRYTDSALRIPGFEYLWTCKCPVCEDHWRSLRGWSSGHPTNCHCSGCTKIKIALEQGCVTPSIPHHRNCQCTKCYLDNPFPAHNEFITVAERPDLKIRCTCSGPHLPPFEPDPRLTQRIGE